MNKFKKQLLYLIKLNSSPNQIALGVALGVFIGILPLYGFHTLLVIICALLIPYTNKLAILLGTNISIPPTTPFITYAGYKIGKFLLDKNYPDLNWSNLKNMNYKELANLFYPLFLGSVFLGIASALLFYILILLILNYYKRKKCLFR